jgi:hypothetical protein
MQRTDANLDIAGLMALAVVALGWFAMSTLVVDFGLWQRAIRFYEVWAVIQDPAGELTGARNAHVLTTLAFGVVCACALIVPLVCMWNRQPAALLTYLIPFIVTAVSGAVLYAQGSMNTVVANSDAHSTSAYLAHIAQAAIGRASTAVATRIAVGAGAYLAVLGSSFLLLRGLIRYRNAATSEVEPRAQA